MGTLVVTFAFPSDAQSFTATTGADTVGSWQSGDGTPSAGCLQLRISGRSKTNANNVYSRTLTFEAMGVPAGSTITGITSGSAYYRCREWVSGNVPGNNADFVRLTPSGQSAITIAGAASYTNISGWAVSSGVDSTGLSLPSITSCVIAWQADLSTGKNNSAAVTLACDLITFTVTYSQPTTANPPTVFGTGSAGSTSATTGASASAGTVAGTGFAHAVTASTPTSVDVNAPITGVVGTGNMRPAGEAAGSIPILSLNLGGAARISVTTPLVAAVSGVEGTVGQGALRIQDGSSGSIPIFSLNLEEYAQSDTVRKYTSDTFTPTLTEDTVDSITVTMFDRFAPRLEGAGVVQLSGGIFALIDGVEAAGSAGDITVRFGVGASAFGVQAVSEASNFVRPTTQVNVTLTGRTGTGLIGALSGDAGGATSTQLADVDATGSAGTISVRYGVSASASGVAGTGAAGTVAQAVPVSASLTGVAGAGAAGAIPTTGAASFSITGVYAISRLGAVIANPGREGSVIRRTNPGKGPRTVRVGR